MFGLENSNVENFSSSKTPLKTHFQKLRVPLVRYNVKKVNKIFAIGSRSFVRGASSQSYNKFVGLRSGVNFIIPCETLVLCRDSFFVSASQSTLQMNVKLLHIMSNSRRL